LSNLLEDEDGLLCINMHTQSSAKQKNSL